MARFGFFDQRGIEEDGWREWEKPMKVSISILALLCLAATPIPSPKVLGTWPAKPPAPSLVWPVSPAEVWLAAGNTVPGTGIVTGDGSQAHPFWGDFDFIMNNMPPACWIHGGPGRFRSACSHDLWMKTRQRFSGAGMGITTLWRDRSFSIPRDMSVLKGSADGITIEDVTLDPNGDPSDQAQRNGVNMFGNLCTVRRVEVIHATGSWTNGMECFPIFMGFGPLSYGNTVEQCYVHDPMGDYVSAIDLNGQGAILNNRVEFPNWDGAHFQCLLAAYTHSVLISGNYTSGGIGFYTDTSTEHDITIRDNYFDKCPQGVLLWKTADGWGLDGIRVLNNTISLTTNSTPVNEWTLTGISLWVKDTNQPLVNVTIEGNVIRSVYPPARAIALIGVGNQNIRNARILNNTVPQGSGIFIQDTATASALNNTTPDGRLATQQVQ